MMSDRGSRALLYEQLARVGKVFGNGKRLELLELLVQGPRGVVELAEAAGQGVTTTSAHLQTLKNAGLVATDRAGTTVRYHVSGGDVAALYGQLLDVAAAHSADVDAAAQRYLGSAEPEAIGRAELLRRVNADEAVVLDVRPTIEYQAGHIPGAVSIPLAELSERLDELPTDQEVVAYCRGAYCVFSHDAVRLLIAHGRRAVRLDEGIVEWQTAGHPLSAATS